MQIHHLSRQECLELLAENRLMRLACAHENQPYIIPVYLVYHKDPEGESWLYGFTTRGQKIDWMRQNPLVCVESDSVKASDKWISVIVQGRFEEMPETSRTTNEALRMPVIPEPTREAGGSMGVPGRVDPPLGAWQIVRAFSEWQEPGYTTWRARTQPDSDCRFVSVFYRIRLDAVTGHKATPD
ncbi:pyridoxamine 5'-phosphate oxidase family protein [soil metagenome]